MVVVEKQILNKQNKWKSNAGHNLRMGLTALTLGLLLLEAVMPDFVGVDVSSDTIRLFSSTES
jgi:hypothetical protein